MSADVGFPVCLGLTVLLLALVVATGAKARLAWHIPLVFGMLVALGATIAFAKGLGRRYDLEAAGAITPIHLFIAKVTTVAYVLPVVTGLLTLRNRSRKRFHLWAAVLVLVLTVVTVVTGCLMLHRAPPLRPLGR